MPSDRVRAVLNRNKELKRRKNPWLSHFQLIGQYILTRKQNFTMQFEQGAFLVRELFDNTAIKANDVMASALIGALWPNSAKTFQMKSARNIPDGPEEKEYFIFVTNEMASIMDDSRAGLTVALTEYMKDQGSFGTSGIAIFENPKGPLPIRYKAWDVKTMSIDENQDGFVDTIYNECELTPRKVVQEYGIENVSAETKDSFLSGKDKKVIVLHAIEPRMDADPLKFGSKDMPIASIHIEVRSGKILRESGFEEMPVPVTRFSKALGEMYGRSPGMGALSDIIELNAIWEAVTLAIEKNLDPPLAVLSDGDLGPAIIDTSAGAINVFNISGRAGKQQQPIFPLFTVGEINTVVALIEKRVAAINEHFFIDRLLDLNNDTRMTLGEAQIRNELRGASLGSIFARQEAEMFTPAISRTFNLMLKLGRLGVIKGSQEEAELRAKGIEPRLIPESVARAMVNGEEVFQIKYISPAKRTMQAEEVQGLLASWNFAITSAPVVPDIMDNYDTDFIAKRLAEITGASEEAIRDSKTIKDIRALRAAELAKVDQLEKLREASEVARNLGQAKGAQGKTAENL